ncbi:hypothetical protein HGD87_05280 [Rhodobacteraceae bacterium R_SAG9]|nr:hypothetical protein [Rhodobacteraceae bacterium R_SAG9]
MFKKAQSSLEGFRNETSHWQFMNVFFKPSITRFFISWFALAPAVVKAVQNLPNPLIFTVGAETYQVPLDLPFRWEMLWWASLIYALAFVLHLIFCPGFIKRYPNYNAYTDRGHSPRWLVWEVYRAWGSVGTKAREKLFDRLASKNYAKTEATCLSVYAKPSVSEDGTKWAFKHKGETLVLSIDENLRNDRQKDLFWEILARHGESLVLLRYLVWLLLGTSAVFVLLVVLQNVSFVLGYIAG